MRLTSNDNMHTNNEIRNLKNFWFLDSIKILSFLGQKNCYIIRRKRILWILISTSYVSQYIMSSTFKIYENFSCVKVLNKFYYFPNMNKVININIESFSLKSKERPCLVSHMILEGKIPEHLKVTNFFQKQFIKNKKEWSR